MTAPYLNNSDGHEEEPTEPLGPRARTLAEQHVAAFEAWFEEKYGHPLGEGPRTPMHPEQWEAEQRQAERAERDRDFLRVYGDGR